MNIHEILALIQKAPIATALGGQLSTEEAKEFIDATIAQNDFLKLIQTVQMTSSKYQLNTIEIASRVMRAAAEGVDPQFTQGVTIIPRELEYREAVLPYDITFSFLEENIEGAGAESKINQMFAKAFGNEILDLAINGNTSLAALITDANTDGCDDTTGLTQNDHNFMRQNNGWLKIAHDDSAVHQVVLPASITSWKTEFKRVLQQMPNKWKGNTTELVFLVSPDIETAYRDELSERTTALGDAYLTTSRNAQYQGIDVKPIPFWPGSNKPSIMLTKPKNLAIGIGRSIRTGRQVQERKRVIEYTITAKVDFNYAISDMIVLAEK